MKALVFLLVSALAFVGNSQAQISDSIYSCRGKVDQDQNRLIILNMQFKLGGLTIEGDLNGDPIVGSNFGSGNFVQAVAYPKSQSTGNVSDIKHKMTANVNQQDGQFNLTVVGVHGHSFFLSGRGQCLIQN